MAPNFERLVRFKNPSGQMFYGELGLENAADKDSLCGSSVRVYKGYLPWDDDFALTSQQEEVAEVLSPIPTTPIFECIGLNYKAHIAETGCFADEEYPTIFTKPPDALAGPYDDVPIHKECQNMDYEAELCLIVGEDCKNVTTDAEAMSCILGYTAGNDLSSRFWQVPARSGNQHGLAKSFDKFAPIGPTILNPTIVHNSRNGLAIRSYVNGELRQDARTDDLIFDVATIIRHLTRGKTLRRGTVIMTGTPSGVGALMKPAKFLKDRDVVEIEIENIGRMRNVMVSE